ncbi:MAG: hypothetical protein ACO1NW_18540 [Chitinophagaceae bacterium]
MRLLVLFVCIVNVFGACSGDVSPGELAAYVNNPNNRIRQSIKVGNIIATAKWLPPGLSGNDADGYMYFELNFNSVVNKEWTKEQMTYLNFDMGNDFVLIKEGRRFSPAICQKVEDGIVQNEQYMLAFECVEDITALKDITLVYSDKIFGIGDIAFAFKATDMKRIPAIKPTTGK